MNKFSNITALILLPLIVFSQSESILKSSLEGKRVEVLIEMPATSEGIDLYVDKANKMKFDNYSQRLKEHGIALYPGDIVMITKIKKKSKHIEFQLAGGGYGTFGDEDGSVWSNSVPKSSREEQLEKLLSDKDNKVENESELKKELRDLKRQRELEQDKANRDAALQSEMKKSRLQEQKRQGGSRFNIRYDNKVGAEELTVESIVNALQEYVSFSDKKTGSNESTDMDVERPTNIKKGMTIEQAITLYGMPSELKTSESCDLSKTTCTFSKDDTLIETVFVENVLVKYTMTSR